MCTGCAAQLFGAHMQVKTIAATGNVSERLTRLMAKVKSST